MLITNQIANSIYRQPPFRPLNLLPAGSVGALYDPLDLYQDSAVPPVTPASAVGDPIGTIVSQVSGGFNWRQATAGNKMTVGNLPRGGVRTQCTTSNLFNDAAWNVKTNLTITQGASDPFGGTTAWTMSRTSGASSAVLGDSFTGLTGTNYVGSWYVRRNSGTGTVDLIVGDNVNQTINPTSSWQRLYATDNTSSTTIRNYISLTGAGTDTIDICYSQIEFGTTPSALQVATNPYTITESGVPTLEMPYFGGDDYAVLSVNGTGVQELSSTADFFADTGKAWGLGGAFSILGTGSYTIIAKCSGGGSAVRTLQFSVEAGILNFRVRGVTTSVGSNYNDGRLHAWILWDGATFYFQIDGTTYTVTAGAAAEEAEVVTFGCRTESSPAIFMTGFCTVTALFGYAPSTAQIAQYMSQQRSYWGSP